MSTGPTVVLLVGSKTVPAWFRDTVSRAVEESDATISSVVVAKGDGSAPEKSIRFYLEDIHKKGSWTLVALGRKLFNSLSGPLPQLRRHPVTDIDGISAEDIVEASVTSSGDYGCEFSDDVVQSLASADVALHWGIGILKGAALSAPTHGIWGYHHGDIRRYRGGPPGVWEFVEGKSETGVTLQRYTEELDAGGIIANRTIPIEDARTWREIRARQCDTAVPLFSEGLRSSPESSFEPTTVDSLGEVYSRGDIDWRTTLSYIRRSIVGYSKAIADELM